MRIFFFLIKLAKNFLYRRSLSDPSGIAHGWGIRLCRLCLTCSRWTLLLLLCTALRRLIPRDLRLLASHRYNMYCYLLHVLILLRRESNVLILQHSGCFYWAKEKGVQWDRLCCGVNNFLANVCSNNCYKKSRVTFLTQLWKDAYCSVSCEFFE